MSELHRIMIKDFQQPFSQPYTRVMQGPEEIVQYAPNSHVRIWYNTEPSSFENHYHNCVEIIYMYENDCTVTSQTDVYQLKTGDILIIPPYKMHEVVSAHSCRQFILQLDISVLSNFGIFNSPKLSVTDILLCNQDECPQIYETIYNNLTDMINSYFENKPLWEIETYSHYLQILVTTGRFSSLTSVVNADDISPGTREHYDKFSELLQFVENNYSEQLTLDFVSSHVGFSKYHFIRLFKEYTGTTFYDYLTHKRIQHAKELLSGDMGITEISFTCGFNNQTSFCRTFKKICGCPPTEYRQRMKEKDR
ncbi:MAG: AraC family transcriptional regulator [Lachnospiraceae bacterium]|nr:AraC family transcriptional regulator [Lachnospiraceae bacterium]